MTTLKTADMSSSAITKPSFEKLSKVKKRSTKPLRQKVRPKPHILSLPFELFDQIGSYLLPVQSSTKSGFIGPSEEEQRHAIRNVLNLGRTCTLIRTAYGPFLSSMSGLKAESQIAAKAGKGKEKAMREAEDEENKGKEVEKKDLVEEEPKVMLEGKKFLCLDYAVDNQKSAQHLYDGVASNRSTLETITVRKCCHPPTRFPNHRGHSGQSTYLNFLKPYQLAYEDDATEIVLPKLTTLRFGCSVCPSCLYALISLFCADSFSYETESASDEKDKLIKTWDATLSERMFWGRTPKRQTFPNAAARNLKNLVIFLAEHEEQHTNLIGDSLKLISEDLGKDLQMLEIWLRGNGDIWGGFGSNGSFSGVVQVRKEVVEKELSDKIAAAKITPEAMLRKRKAEEKLEGLLEKFQRDLKRIKPSGHVMVKKEDETRMKVDAILAGIKPMPAATALTSVEAPDEVLNSSHLNPDNQHSGTTAHCAVDPRHMTPNTSAGKPSSMHSPSHSSGGSSSDASSPISPASDAIDSPIPIDPVLLADPLARPSAGIRRASTSTQSNPSDRSTPSSANSTSSANPVVPSIRMMRQPNPNPRTTNTSRARLSAYEKASIAQAAQLTNALPRFLNLISGRFPNLVGLRLRRKDGMYFCILEGHISLDHFAEVFVDPIHKMDQLKWLDLGLAVVGKEEVRGFPLGLSCGREEVMTRAEKGKKRKDEREGVDGNGKEMEVAMRKAYLEKVQKARKEGNGWREKVLKRFVLGEIDPSPESMDVTEEGTEKVNTWPKGLISGSMLSVDLVERGKRRGVEFDWRVRVADGVTKLLIEEERPIAIGL